MLRKLLFLTLLSICAAAAISQTPAKSPDPEEDKKLKEKAVAFLRETLGDVNGLRTLENRISFTSELASLMWFQDEREARAMFAGVTTDFRDLLLQYDRQMMAAAPAVDGEVGPSNFLIPDESESGRIQRKLRTAMAVRQQIAMSMAEHDPDLAFTFYYESLNAISNPVYRKQAEDQDKYQEFQLMNLVADKDPGKAAKFGARSLSKGFSRQHIDLLKKIYQADPDKAVAYGSDILSSLKTGKQDSDGLSAITGLISFGEETLKVSQTDGKKKAIYTPGDLRDLAEIMAQGYLDQPTNAPFSNTEALKQIQKYAPGRALQIKAKFKMRKVPADDEDDEDLDTIAPPPPARLTTGVGGVAYATGAANSNANLSPAQQAQLDRQKNEKQMMDDVMKVGNKDLPKDQRDAIIAQARKILLSTPGRDKKIMGLSMLAAQVAKAGDKDLANQIMKDAEALVNPQPKTYMDYLLSWTLATGYASVNPDKAFPTLEDTITRANDTLSAFIKLAEFIDVNGEIIEDGEVQVGSFGGAMISGLTREMDVADSTIRVLAKADFDKTKDLANRFERPEIRVLAKMLVLRAVLGDKNQQKPDALDPDVNALTK